MEFVIFRALCVVAGIERLKALFGPQYTKKLEDMYQDLTVAEEAARVGGSAYVCCLWASALSFRVVWRAISFWAGVCESLRLLSAVARHPAALGLVFSRGAKDVLLACHEHVCLACRISAPACGTP